MESGEGQYVDVSMQEAAVSPNMNVLQMWDVNKVEFKRVGSASYVAGTESNNRSTSNVKTVLS
jgi:crotonobetainyl-CoA:carnitine CoA-transferase CaiB-like acyl-CoA transferase